MAQTLMADGDFDQRCRLVPALEFAAGWSPRTNGLFPIPSSQDLIDVVVGLFVDPAAPGALRGAVASLLARLEPLWAAHLRESYALLAQLLQGLSLTIVATSRVDYIVLICLSLFVASVLQNKMCPCHPPYHLFRGIQTWVPEALPITSPLSF